MLHFKIVCFAERNINTADNLCDIITNMKQPENTLLHSMVYIEVFFLKKEAEMELDVAVLS